MIRLVFLLGALTSASFAPPAPYIAPYGLTKADLGAVQARNFVRAVLGAGTVAEQNAALALFAAGGKEGAEELARLTVSFARKTGVQAVVWRDVHTGTLVRASDRVRFDPANHRVELVFARLDPARIQAQPAGGANAITSASRDWVAGIARAEKKDPKTLQPAHALAGILGGSGHYRAGNIVPLYRNARKGVDRLEAFPILFSQDVDPVGTVILVVVAYQYPNGTSRIPSRIYYRSGVSKAVSGRGVDNRPE